MFLVLKARYSKNQGRRVGNMRSDWKVGIEKDNKNQVLIKDDQIHRVQEVVIEGPEVDIVEEKKAKSRDEDIVRVVEEMKKAGVKKLRGEE